MDKLTIDRIKTSHPILRDRLEKEYIECNNLLPKGVRLRFSHVYRSYEEQEHLFNKKPKVTNARGGQSIHNYGLAFDYVVLIDKDKNGTFESIDWNIGSEWHKRVINYFKNKGYEWGGDWKSFKDYPHFQAKKTDGSSYSWRELIKLPKIKDFNGLNYPKL